jgi:broad specificity phosphatase PhoE
VIIHLIRHGQTTGDIEERYGGDYDDHLTELGQQQSAQLADKLAGRGIQKLYASPRIRAQETAAAVGEKLQLPVATLDDWRECNRYGILTGMPKSEAAHKHADQVALLRDIHQTVGGAEAYEPFKQRILLALAALSGESHDAVAVVTHGGPIRAIFREVLGQGEIDADDCAYVVLETDGTAYKVIEMQGIRSAS